MENAKPMSRLMRSLCQEECEADVKMNAKPMSRYANNLIFRRDYWHTSDMLFQIMRSVCQEECEADVKINAKAMSRIMRRLCQD